MEKRKHLRFQTHEGSYAVLKTDSIKVGQIINISKGGLSLCYIGNGKPIKGLHNIDIFFSSKQFYLKGIPFISVSDFYIDNKVPFSTILMKQCGGQFGELTHSQIYQLDYFIANHTIG